MRAKLYLQSCAEMITLRSERVVPSRDGTQPKAGGTCTQSHTFTHSAVGLQDRWLVEPEEGGPDLLYMQCQETSRREFCLELQIISISNGDPLGALQVVFLLEKFEPAVT